ncbi:unnamed protein product, partial [Allacma fusca]
ADCPKGLICCSFEEPDDELDRRLSALKPTDGKHPDNDQLTPSLVPVIENETELFYPEPILDPIPDDESSEILKV